MKAAAYHNVRGKVETVEATQYQTAFERSKAIDAAQSVVLKY